MSVLTRCALLCDSAVSYAGEVGSESRSREKRSGVGRA